MTISLSFKDADKDGKGINFDSYLKAFDKKFELDGRGEFNDPDIDGEMYSTDEYVALDGKKNGQSVVFHGDFEYSMATHEMTSTIDSLTFGKGTKANNAETSWSNNGEITIGFDPVESDGGVGTLLYDTMYGGTKQLYKLLKSDVIEFEGSKGKDVFTSFGKSDSLWGGKGADKLDGAGGADTIDGDKGNDILTGGTSADTFLFSAGDGNDKITDFKPGADELDFGKLFKSFDDVIDAAKDTNHGVKINFDGGSVLLEKLEISDLHDRDFGF